MEKVLLHTDNGQVRERLAERRKIETSLNEIHEAYNKLGVGELATNQLTSLIIDPETFIFQKMTKDNSPNIAGLPIHAHKAMEMLVKPTGYETLIALITQYKKKFNTRYLEHFEIEDGNVILSQSSVDKEVEHASLYAKTEEDKRRLEFAKFIKEKGEEIWGDPKKVPYPILATMFRQNQESARKGDFDDWEFNYHSFIRNNQ